MFDFVYLNVGLLVMSQYMSELSWNRPTRSKFSPIFLGPRATAELVSKLHDALQVSVAALPILI
jgi:hypothetical protein